MRVVKLKKELKEVLRIYKYILHTLQKVERKTYAALRKKSTRQAPKEKIYDKLRKIFFYILKTVMNVCKRETVK